MQYRVVVVQPNESAIFFTTRASDVKTRVLKSWLSSRMYMMSRDGGSLWGCDNCDWAEMIPAEPFLRIDRAIDDVKLLSWIESENDALFFLPTVTGFSSFSFFFALASSYRRFDLNRGFFLFCFYSRGNFQSNSAMILSVQIISIFCITLNNNADGIFLSWIYFV